MTMPSSPSKTTLPSPAGLTMVSPGFEKLFGDFRKYSGSFGADRPSLSPSALKLFHSATTLLGRTGASSFRSASASVLPVASGAEHRAGVLLHPVAVQRTEAGLPRMYETNPALDMLAPHRTKAAGLDSGRFTGPPGGGEARDWVFPPSSPPVCPQTALHG